MIIYNVTVNVDDSVNEEWLNWMKETHIPDVLSTGLFLEGKIFRVMVDEESGITYSVQYAVKDMETLRLYQEIHAPALQKEHKDKFEGKFVAFRTLLEHLHEIKK